MAMKQTNTFCWVDIPVVDLERAIEFYTQLLRAPIRKIAEHGLSFALLPHDEENVSGCLCVTPDRKPSQDGPLVYLNVEGRLQDAVDQAKAHGGEVLSAQEQIGPYGHRAIIVDTEGNSIALYSKEG
jgi:predicted enzyme related to lactoylglutathione lyase